MTKQSFLQGAIILIVAGMITRFMGFINRIVVARLMGEEGVGLYMMALPTLFLVMTLTQFGLPVAISKRVAEADAQNDQKRIKKIVVVSLAITLSASIVFTAILILLSPLVASTLLTDERVMVPLIVISPIIPIAAVSAVLRGYFQGKQNMTPQSVAQVIEQVVRIICVAIFIHLLLPYGVEYAAAGAMFSVILGEFISLLYMVRKFKQKRAIKVRNNFFKALAEGKQTAKDLFSISLPTLGSRMIGSFSNFLDPILVVQSLAIAGVTATVATKQYGELTGYAMPLLFLPTFITSSLSIALVPSIAEAEANKQMSMIHNRIHQSIRISFASGAISTVVLTIFATEILTYMYGTSSASKFLLLMAPFFIFLYIQAPLQSALQALDLARPAMWNSLIGMGMKFIVMILFASNPSFGILGAAMAICASVVIVTLLHLAVLKKNINYMIPFIDFVKMIVLISVTFGIGYALKQIIPNLDGQIIIFGALLMALLLIYILLLFILKFITKQELQQIPIFRKK